MVKLLDSNLEISEFEFESCYYVHFWTNSLGKGIKPLIPMGGILSLLCFDKDSSGSK